ncbi:type I-E CRISPR-associated protein Cas7/Cse4/CasC [Streptomyces sp. NPDC000927]|uniref:type I-E CRISPR-associated protein Cas7/Cse4/CasC n=1 Tax=Streptomyces sp. NPDC000927 TaxID=3154371 RepID=UPI00332758C0
MNAIYIDRIQIHSYPYGAPNRDRNGSPKTCSYNGTTRGRLSSQHEKRHERTVVEELLGSYAVRTRNTPTETAKILVEHGWDEKHALLASQLLIINLGIKGLGITEAGGTNALLFLPSEAITELSDVANRHRDHIEPVVKKVESDLAKAAEKAKKAKAGDLDDEEKEEQEDTERISLLAKNANALLPKGVAKSANDAVCSILHSRNASVAAYGRMLANDPGSTVEAAIQTMHSFSTHTVSTQMDSFTAVDDIAKALGGGGQAAHLGEQRYNAATYYKYTTINVTELIGNLGGDVNAALGVTDGCMRAPFLKKEGGKHTSTAPHTLPHLVYAAVRTDRPVNLAGAFAVPIPASTNGYLEPSCDALNEHAGAHHRLIGTKGIAGHAYTGLTERDFSNLGTRVASLDDFAEITLATVKQVLGV